MNEFELFQRALDIEDTDARQLFLKSACSGNPALLRRVESLLESHYGQSQFLETPVAEQIIVHEVLEDDEEPQSTVEHSDENALYGELHEAHDYKYLLDYLNASTKPGSLGRLGHYEIMSVVGRGAFGTVLQAFDEKLQRLVAIKVMARELAATSPARKRFMREAQASAGIRHENVVSVFAVEEQPLPYLVMEFVPGQTLNQYLIDHGPLEISTVLSLGRQIAEGLAAAHSQGLIHRDIKPSNILLEPGPSNRVKITDFGLARAADDASLTQSGVIAGTPMFMAPEQALGQKLDQRADLFSLGSVLYQMVSGRPPFRANNTVAALKRVTEDTPRSIREIIPETPQWLCDIIGKLHAKNPDDRYQSARDVAEVLADCESQLRSHAVLNDYSLIPRIAKQPLRPRFWIMASALFLLLLAIVVFAIYSRPNDQPSLGKGSEKGSSTIVSPSMHQFVSDEWIDVIPLVDPVSDKFNVPQVTGKNDWRIEHDELVILRDQRGSKLLFPLDSQWNAFECEIDFTRRIGDSGFNFNIPTKTGECPLVIDAPGSPGGVFLGSRKKGVVLHEGRKIVTSERSTVRVQVDSIRGVEVEFNGTQVGSWTGDCDSISSATNEDYLHARRLSIWIHPGGNEFVFHRIRVRTLGGSSAESLRPVAPTLNSK